MSAFTLKMIAVVTMFIDHFAHMFGGRLVFALVPAMRAVGRLAFPIFVYFIGEGYRRTGDVNKYLARLGIFALISEIPFDLMAHNVRNIPMLYPLTWLELSHQNVFFTLFLGLFAANIYNKASTIPKLVALLPLPFVLAYFLQADYGVVGVVMVFGCAVLDHKPLRLALLFAGGLVLYSPLPADVAAAWMVGYTAALGLLVYYNGTQGPRLKWMFYSFYPLHILVLFGLLVLYESLV